MSQVCKVNSGDFLRTISSRYYGDASRWVEIARANPHIYGRGEAVDGSPLIFPGDVLVIPDDADDFADGASSEVTLDDGTERDFELYVDGKKYTGFTSWSINMSNSRCDAFSFSSIWNSERQELRELFKPFGYKKCSVKYMGKQIFNGYIVKSTTSVSPTSRSVSCDGYPLCGVLNDSCLPDTLFPPEYSGLNFLQIAKKVCGVFGVKVKCDVDVGGTFEKVEIEVGEKVYDFLAKLARQRGLLLTNSQDGSLLVWKQKKGGGANAVFHEGEPPFVSCEPSFDEQKMFSHITGFTKTGEKENAASYTFENSLLVNEGVLRVHNEVLEDANASGIEAATKSLAGRMLANCVRYKLTVSGHKDKNGKLYEKNMLVAVKSRSAYIANETLMQVDDITLSRDDNTGAKTEMSLVLQGAWDGELPSRFPWED